MSNNTGSSSWEIDPKFLAGDDYSYTYTAPQEIEQIQNSSDFI
jgi:hypothetical protein